MFVDVSLFGFFAINLNRDPCCAALFFFFNVTNKQKYGLIAAVRLEDIKIMVHKGKLVNESNSDVKVDYDPTQHINDKCSITTYKQVFYETTRFINDNNSADRAYLQYPKLYFQRKNSIKCGNKQNCKECFNNNRYESIFGLCLTKRREIGDEMYDNARKQKCITDSLTKTAAKLFMSSELLIKDSSEYTLNLHWFAKLYSFLKCYEERITMSLHDLVNENMKSNQIHEDELDDDMKKKDKQDNKEQENEYNN